MAMRPSLRSLRRLGTLALASTLLGLTAAPAHALTGDALRHATHSVGTTARAAADADADEAVIRLLSTDTPFLPDTSSELELRVSVINPTELPRAEESVHLLLDRIPVSTAAELESLTVDPGEIVPVRRDAEGRPMALGVHVATVKIPEIAPHSSEMVNVTLSGNELPWRASDPAGVYVFRSSGSGDRVDSAVPVVWRGSPSGSPLTLSSVVALRFPQGVTAMPSVGDLDELFQPNNTLSKLLEQAIASGASIGVDPGIIAAIRARGTAAPQTAIDWLETLRAAPNETFPLPFADADLSAQAQLGYTRPLQPDTLDFITKDSTFPAPQPVTSSADTGAPEPEASPETPQPSSTESTDRPLSDSAEGEAVVEDPNAPSVRALTAWDYTRTDVAWPRANTLTEDSLSFFRANGYTTALTTFTNASLSPSGSTSGTRNGVSLVPVTARLQEQADEAILSVSPEEQSRGIASLVASLAVTDTATPATVALDRAAVETEAGARLLAAVSSLPWVSPVEIGSGPSGTAKLTSMPLPEDRLADLERAIHNEGPIAQTARVLEHPEYLTGLQRIRVLRFFSASIDPAGPTYAEASDRYFTRDQDTLTGVTIAGTNATTQLIGTSSRVPVQVKNTLPFAAIVTAHSTAVNSGLQVLEPQSEPTIIPASSSVNILVPVSARVSSGESALEVSLHNSEGEAVTEAVLPMSIHSTWETTILVVFGSLVLAFFGFGIWRSIRHARGQRSRIDVAAVPSGSAE